MIVDLPQPLGPDKTIGFNLGPIVETAFCDLLAPQPIVEN